MTLRASHAPRSAHPYPLILAIALGGACGDPNRAPRSNAHSAVGRVAFSCGELDLYDLDAIMSGGAFEGLCSDVPVGTWKQVAADLRAATTCDHQGDYVPDPDEACDIAACANRLMDGAAASTCEDFSAFATALQTAECARLSYYTTMRYEVFPC